MSFAAPVAITCPHCSAPLRPNGRDNVVRCSYCGTDVVVAPAGQMHNSNVAPRHVVGIAVATAVLVVVALVAASYLMFDHPKSQAMPFVVPVGGGTTPRMVSTLPAACANNEHLIVQNATFSGSGAPLTIGTNCVLVLERTTIRSTAGLVGTSNLHVSLVDSILVVSNGPAIDLGNVGTFTATGASEIGSTGGDAIVTGGVATVQLKGTKVHATGAAIRSVDNAKVLLDASDLRGSSGIVCGNACAFQLYNHTTVFGTSVGVACTTNAVLDVRSADIEGGSGSGIDVQTNSLFTFSQATIGGAHAAVSALNPMGKQTVSDTKFDGPVLVDGRAGALRK